jgi:predicted ribosomally synthesized peptide with nif11-like leader
MSIYNLKQFQKHVLQDFALQDQLKEACNAEQFASMAVKLGKKMGYHFTIEDVKAVSTARRSPKTFSQQQLEAMLPELEPAWAIVRVPT